MSLSVWLTVVLLGTTTVPGGAQEAGTLRIKVTHDGRPLAGAAVTAGPGSATTDPSGEAILVLPAGPLRVEVSHEGLETGSAAVTVRAQAETLVTVELRPHLELEEDVIVTATRTGRRLQDQAVRVEVLAQEEIEEKLLMTPGDVAMLLNETGGLRVQVASPSLGAANVRIQGLRGRYTLILADVAVPHGRGNDREARGRHVAGSGGAGWRPYIRPTRRWSRSSGIPNGSSPASPCRPGMASSARTSTLRWRPT